MIPLFAAVAVLIPLVLLIWRSRRTLPGLILYYFTVAIPSILVRRLLPARFTKTSATATIASHPAIEIFSAALLQTMSWGSETPDIKAIANVIEASKELGKKELEQLGAITRTTPHGIWIAQSAQDIPVHSDAEAVDGDLQIVVVMHVHGGGYCSGHLYQVTTPSYEIIKSFNATTPNKNRRLVYFMIDYKKAPEHPFPAALHAATDSYKFILSHQGIHSIVVGGDSAGAHAVISMLNAFKKENRVMPDACILHSPWVDPSLKILPRVLYTDVFCVEASRRFSRAAFTDAKDRDLVDVPAEDVGVAKKGTFVIYGGAEMLVDAIDTYVEALKEASSERGAAVEVWRAEGMPHTFATLPPLPGFKGPIQESRRRTVDFLIKYIS
ncbi:hypothetical protein HDU99_000002 [Rhizoclosmatium hyalinum]|nr:hypothetical protein HDU99_000002 [Rhizoclosmatium hyalinum]